VIQYLDHKVPLLTLKHRQLHFLDVTSKEIIKAMHTWTEEKAQEVTKEQTEMIEVTKSFLALKDVLFKVFEVKESCLRNDQCVFWSLWFNDLTDYCLARCVLSSEQSTMC
jgi:hypothetical protein